MGIRRNSNEDGAVTASLTDSEFSGSTSRLGSASAAKVSWPICRDLPGDCGTANLRSDNVKVDARVVRSVMVKSWAALCGGVKSNVSSCVGSASKNVDSCTQLRLFK